MFRNTAAASLLIATVGAILILTLVGSGLIAASGSQNACWHGEIVNVEPAARTLSDGTELVGEIDYIGHAIPAHSVRAGEPVPVYPNVVVCTAFPDTTRRGDH